MLVFEGATTLQALAYGVVTAALLLAVMPWLDRSCTWHRALVNLFAAVLVMRYLYWRWTETLPSVSEPLDFGVGIAFIIAECVAIGATLITLFVATRESNRTPAVDAIVASGRLDEQAPLVDVLICTYNEEEEILERTIIGANQLDYPNFRVWVLDDGRRDWLRRLCDQHGCGYIARSDNKHAKAGNINNTLVYLDTLEQKPEFISILDADFVPVKSFIKRCIALFADDTVGIVQTPQHFGNPDPMQANLAGVRVLPDEQRFFFDSLQPCYDAWNASLCCGTSSVLRFSALQQIGGFPTESVTEDYLVSLKMQSLGFKTVYLNERLSHGLAAEGLREFVSQRRRWCLGFMQICHGEMSPLRLGNGLRAIERLILFSAFMYWSGVHTFRLFSLWLPPLFLLFNVQAVYTDVPSALMYFLPYYLATITAIVWFSNGRFLPVISDVGQLLVAKDLVKTVAVGIVKSSGHAFAVTAKGGDRSTRFVQWPMVYEYLAYLAFTLAAIAWTFYGPSSDYAAIGDVTALALAWSWYNIVILVVACFVCIEQPRRDQRYPTDLAARIDAGNISAPGRVVDLSISGARIVGGLPADIGSRVHIAFSDVTAFAHIVRKTGDGYAVMFDKDEQTRRALIRHVYGGRYHCSVSRADPIEVGALVLGRVFR